MIGESSSLYSTHKDIEDCAADLALAAELALQDVQDISASRKGKANALCPKTDEEIAFEMMAEEAQSLLALARDITFARSLDSALGADHDIIGEVLRADEVARSDREYALALSEGRALPSTSTADAIPKALGRLNVSATPESGSSLVSMAPMQGVPATASSSKVQLALPSQQLTAKSKQEMCTFCREQINGTVVRAPCGHSWDTDCLSDLFRAATTDESLFPPRCCQQPFVLKDVQHHLGAELLRTFNTIAVEFGTANRVYCHRPTCSAFICPATETSTPELCRACLAQTCGHCKERAHIGTPCITDDAPILALAEQEGWARCPGCKHLVELTYGCYHITCRCRKQFCYLCAETWKNCACLQWDEQRLLVTARDRVERELPAGRPPPPETRLQEMVIQAADRLRVDHECKHWWVYHSGAGHCENCSYYLPKFLLRCRKCSMCVCVRCRRNRL